MDEEPEYWLEEHGRIMDRICGDAREPFTIEPFCAQLAWMEPKCCPLYPFNSDGEGICRYLTEDGHESYRCPNVRVMMDIAGPIVKNGTEEQRRALEFMADMSARYGLMENPPAKASATCIADAIEIYRALGCEEKARSLVEKFPVYRGTISP